MADPLTLLVGLGNPGAEYAGKRHNVGFMALDAIAHRYNFGAPRSRFRGAIAEGRVGNRKVLALKPMTYMNRSGESVAEAAAFYKIPASEVIVLYDEIDLAPGKLKVKRGGGAAGHNGIRSLDLHIDPDFWRVRLGVGHPGHKELVHGYVLHDFGKAEHVWLDPLLDAVAAEIGEMLEGKPELFMTKVADRLTPPKEPKPPKPPAPSAVKQPRPAKPDIEQDN